ncbi:hypothetical protein Y11_20021 [Yersinia enterocolitica subsp. palearctica Y11]|uniref:Uncharacterized protein n=1 Tax=Yersinia enterocolitica subsp. palearctica serotype O:3 (strain DSM 13030 / CIP 106945 / Y11) TaxID=930944 RepID=A0A0H3NSC3_YERE1|nr:hypothetical protein FORC066_3398 [Yersinia enterocolitica]CBY26179.1 hypothetical protein Y11_20021 [Yersinia enterocolitica subsp. palearctica Y11]CCO69607.1 hypothetical protein D322_2733 [Yersinia enterocolitica IP 10393]
MYFYVNKSKLRKQATLPFSGGLAQGARGELVELDRQKQAG